MIMEGSLIMTVLMIMEGADNDGIDDNGRLLIITVLRRYGELVIMTVMMIMLNSDFFRLIHIFTNGY